MLRAGRPGPRGRSEQSEGRRNLYGRNCFDPYWLVGKDLAVLMSLAARRRRFVGVLLQRCRPPRHDKRFAG